MANSPLAIAAGALVIGGTALLAWRSPPVQDAAIAAGDWCFQKEHSLVCAVVTGVAANLLTHRLGNTVELLEPVATMCSKSPGSCLWLGSVISFVALDSTPKGDTYIISNTLYRNRPPDASPVYTWRLPAADASGLDLCKTHPGACAAPTVGTARTLDPVSAAVAHPIGARLDFKSLCALYPNLLQSCKAATTRSAPRLDFDLLEPREPPK